MQTTEKHFPSHLPPADREDKTENLNKDHLHKEWDDQELNRILEPDQASLAKGHSNSTPKLQAKTV